MKKYLLFLLLVSLIGCDKDTPGQLETVHGTVTNYLTGEPLSDIPLIIATKESWCFTYCNDYILDTVYSDIAGNYSYEFYTDSISRRNYFIFALTPSGYSYSCEQMIRGGESNKIDFLLKPFIKVHIKLINKKDDYNAMFLYNFAISTCMSEFIYDSNLPVTESITCNGDNCDTIQNVIPGARNYFQIGLSHYNEGKWGDTTKDSSVYFHTGATDTIFTFYY